MMLEAKCKYTETQVFWKPIDTGVVAYMFKQLVPMKFTNIYFNQHFTVQ